MPLLPLFARKCSYFFFFITLSIFNDINALKRLGCQPLEAQWDVQPSDASQGTEAEHGGDAIDLEKCDILEGREKAVFDAGQIVANTHARAHVHTRQPKGVKKKAFFASSI